MKIFAIIVTYNAQRWIDKCFSSLLASSIAMDIIVVDNLSQDDTLEIIERDYPQVEVIRNSKNLGFGQANNLAMRVALERGADYVLLLNQDAWIFEDTLSRLLDTASARTDAAIISPIHLDDTELELDKYFAGYISKTNFKLRARGLNHCSEFIVEPFDVPFINAAVWLISRSCLEKVGGFDPIFFHYGEDMNYAQRVIYHNFKTMVVPESFAVHDRADVILSSKDTASWTRNILVIELCDINRSFVSAALRATPLFCKMLLLLIFGSKAQRANVRIGFKNFFSSCSQILVARKRARKSNQSL